VTGSGGLTDTSGIFMSRTMYHNRPGLGRAIARLTERHHYLQ
jgi:hypothetical protein